MSFALKYGSINQPERDSGLIYFDAVTQYSRDYSGQVSSHPLANGTQISDHFVRQNPKFSISAVISGVDINTWTTLIRDAEDVQPYNSYSNVPVSVEGNDNSFGLLPDSIGQWLNRESPIVSIDETRTDYTPQVEQALIRLMEGMVYDQANSFWRTNAQLVTIYEMDGLLMKREVPNLVITGLRFQEDVRSGDALIFSMQLEQISFKFTERTKLSQQVVKLFAKQAAEEQRKTNADSTEGNDPAEAVLGTQVETVNQILANKEYTGPVGILRAE